MLDAPLPSNQTEFLADAGAIAAHIPDGAFVALPPDYSLVAMEVVRALIRREAKDLRLLGVPVLGFCADLLIGAGCVREVETSAVSLGEAGLAPRFSRITSYNVCYTKLLRNPRTGRAAARRAGAGPSPCGE